MKWAAQARNAESEGKLPNMRADIVLEAKDRSRMIVIDTKFSKATLEEYRGNRSVKAQDLRQIVIYLETAARSGLCGNGVLPEGLLLYPKVDDTPPLDFQVHGFNVSLRTIDLSTSDTKAIRESIERLPQSILIT